MNDVIKQLFNRKSIRVFTDTEIAEEIKDTILQAATQAPTAGNQQLYTIIDVTDQSIKDQLAETCDHQPFISTAKMVLIFCADCQKWYDAFMYENCTPRHPGAGDLLLAANDAIIAAQNAVVAAESFGIGSCYIGDILENCEAHRSMLNLPDYVVPVTMLVFGYPTTQQQGRKKPARVDMKHIVHINGYRHMDRDELATMLSSKAPGGYNDWIHAFCKRKYNSDFSKEMSRSAAKYLESFMDPAKK